MNRNCNKTMSNYLEEALRLASLGYAVFPCAPKRKVPFVLKAPQGCNSATINERVITEWWNEFPNNNIGLKCENVLVMDIDRKGGKDGTKDLTDIIRQLGSLPQSPVSVTPTGGFHLFFAKPDEDIIGKTGLLWNGVPTGIDIRIGNQYVVVPPSIRDDIPVSDHEHQWTNGVYAWKIPLVSVAELPILPKQWIDNFLPHRQCAVASQPMLPHRCHNPLPQVAGIDERNNAKPIIETRKDDTTVIERCKKYLDHVEPCISGQGGDRQLFKAACVVFWDFGLSESEGMPLLQEYNARCLPPWSESRLHYKMHEALNYPHEKERGHLLHTEKKKNYGVDLSEFQFNVARNENNHFECEPDHEDEAEPLVEVPPIPVELLRVPGFVGEVMDFCLENASYPVPAMAFGGALALQSFLCGRKIREPGDLRTNIYLLGLANASVGKDFPRKVVKAVAREIGASYGIGDKFVSGQAIEDSLLLNPNHLFLSDEFDAILNSIKKGKDVSSDMIVSTLLTLYTSANTFYDRRRLAVFETVTTGGRPHSGFRMLH